MTIKFSCRYIKFIFEKIGRISPEQEELAKSAFNKAGILLEKEWGLTSLMRVRVLLMSDEEFRKDAPPNSPASWKYCFLLRDQPDNNVYCKMDIFQTLPKDAEAMIKHETAHLVVAQLVGDISKYKRSYFLEEGTAGLDGATERLIKKLKEGHIKEIPDPTKLKTIQDIKSMGADTNKEPFIEQLGYLILFSIVDFLKKRHSANKIVEIYKKLDSQTTLEAAYQQICGEQLSTAIADWNELIRLKESK